MLLLYDHPYDLATPPICEQAPQKRVPIANALSRVYPSSLSSPLAQTVYHVTDFTFRASCVWRIPGVDSMSTYLGRARCLSCLYSVLTMAESCRRLGLISDCCVYFLLATRGIVLSILLKLNSVGCSTTCLLLSLGVASSSCSTTDLYSLFRLVSVVTPLGDATTRRASCPAIHGDLSGPTDLPDRHSAHGHRGRQYYTHAKLASETYLTY